MDQRHQTAQEEKIRVKGKDITLAYEDVGTGSPAMVLVHSFGGNSAHWLSQVHAFSDTHRMILVDLRGHGDSDIPSNNDYSVPLLAEDLETIVQHAQLDHFILIGHSMGGSAAIRYAAEHPEKVRGLVLAGTPGRSPAELGKKIMESLRSDKYQAVMDDYMEKLMKNARADVKSFLKDGVDGISKEASLNIIENQFAFDPIPELERYTGPVLILSSDGEEQPNSLFNEMPHLAHVHIKGTSHWMQLDKPDEFNEVVKEFVERV